MAAPGFREGSASEGIEEEMSMKAGASFGLDLAGSFGLEGAGAVYTPAGQFCFQPFGDAELVRPFVSHATLTNSFWFAGQLMSWLATSETTGGRLAVAEVTMRKGDPLPAHVHSRENELLLVLEGALTVRAGIELFPLRPGEPVVLQHGTIHHWRADAAVNKILMAFAPAGLENLWIEFSQPAMRLTLPESHEERRDPNTLKSLIREAGAHHGLWIPPQT